MARIPYKAETHGSQKDLQLLANNYFDILNTELSSILQTNIKLNWVSPIKEDDYAEYVDQDFIERLGIANKITTPLKQFWPNGGANWDGLATAGDKVFLIEAKAHISEQQIESTGATAESSKQLIHESLEKTKKYLEVNSNINWYKENYYQYANRLAHLYFLREINKIDAHLLFIYFLNDESVSKNETQSDWGRAINDVYTKLELKRNNNLSDYVHHIYIDTRKFNN